MQTKICSKCEQAKELACFPRYRRSRESEWLLRAECKDCRLAAMASWRDRNRKHIADYNKKKYWADPEARREAANKIYWDNVEENREKAREYAARPENKESRKKNMENFIRKNPDYFENHRKRNWDRYLEHAARRRWIKEKSSMNLTEDQIQEMRDIYWLAKDLTTINGEQYEVDHIIPLQGKDICGLHVPWNLQVLPMDLNRSKRNMYNKSEVFM